MLDALADAPPAELGEQLVEALPTEVEGFRVGPVAEAEHAVVQLRQIGTLRLQVFVQRPGVVRHITLAVGRGADQKYALAREHRAVELVHQEGLHLNFAVVPGQFELLRHELRRSGHGPYQDIDLERH